MSQHPGRDPDSRAADHTHLQPLLHHSSVLHSCQSLPTSISVSPASSHWQIFITHQLIQFPAHTYLLQCAISASHRCESCEPPLHPVCSSARPSPAPRSWLVVILVCHSVTHLFFSLPRRSDYAAPCFHLSACHSICIWFPQMNG